MIRFLQGLAITALVIVLGYAFTLGWMLPACTDVPSAVLMAGILVVVGSLIALPISLGIVLAIGVFVVFAEPLGTPRRRRIALLAVVPLVLAVGGAGDVLGHVHAGNPDRCSMGVWH